MKRSTGVTLSAVLVFFGSAMALLVGFFLVAALKFAPHGSIPTPFLRGALIFDGALDLAFVAWGIASGVGLIRLRQWARMSMLVFSGMMIVFSLIPMLIIPFVPLQIGAEGTDIAGSRRILVSSSGLALFCSTASLWPSEHSGSISSISAA